jgi:anti-anti-sigma regulatory factor
MKMSSATMSNYSDGELMNELIYTSPDCATLKLNGSLTIQNIASLHKIFAESLNLVKELNIDHEAADEFDLTYLQLLVALHKTAVNLNKKIKVDCKHPELFVQMTSEVGSPAFLEKINIQ